MWHASNASSALLSSVSANASRLTCAQAPLHLLPLHLLPHPFTCSSLCLTVWLCALPCSVVYRRHLADDADLEHSEADDAARRWPVAWLILRPAKYGPRHQLPVQVGHLPAHQVANCLFYFKLLFDVQAIC